MNFRFTAPASLALASALLALSTAARADVQLADIADADVQHLSPTTNFGGQTELDYAGGASHKDTITYIKFDVSSINLATITSATLNFSYAYAGDNRSDPGDAVNHYTDGQLPLIVGLNDGAADLWSESTITYNNAPGIDNVGTTGALPAQTTQLGVIYPTSGIPGTALPVGSILTLRKSFSDANPDGLGFLNFLKADTNGIITIMIEEGDAESGRAIFSRENITSNLAPTLTLATAAPEPASLALLSPLTLLLLKRRRPTT